jgi:hypothetical protein
MWFWPFSRKPLESPSPMELRDHLVEAARASALLVSPVVKK